MTTYFFPRLRTFLGNLSYHMYFYKRNNRIGDCVLCCTWLWVGHGQRIGTSLKRTRK